MKRQDKSFFASIEGGEGVGKSLFLETLSKSLAGLSVDHQVTREPGGTPLAEKLRDLFKAPPDGESLTIEAEFLMISAARAQHIQRVVRPSLAQGRSILCDRFVDSSRVYQGSLGGIESDFIESVSKLCTEGLEPHVTFLLDCDPAISLARAQSRSGVEEASQDPYDSKDFSFHVKVRESFLELASQDPSRFFILDAAKSVEENVQLSVKHLKGRGYL